MVSFIVVSQVIANRCFTYPPWYVISFPAHLFPKMKGKYKVHIIGIWVLNCKQIVSIRIQREKKLNINKKNELQIQKDFFFVC